MSPEVFSLVGFFRCAVAIEIEKVLSLKGVLRYATNFLSVSSASLNGLNSPNFNGLSHDFFSSDFKFQNSVICN